LLLGLGTIAGIGSALIISHRHRATGGHYPTSPGRSAIPPYAPIGGFSDYARPPLEIVEPIPEFARPMPEISRPIPVFGHGWLGKA